MESERIDSLMKRNDDRNWKDHWGERKKERERERKKEEFSREESSISSIRFDSNSPGFPKIPNRRGISKRIFSWREQK